MFNTKTRKEVSESTFSIFPKTNTVHTSRGFTLIELLVVIAIIGVLSSVVLASLSAARQKSRDARRISDLKQLQLALTLYYDANASTYPPTLASLAPTYIPSIPVDPVAGTPTPYKYAALDTNSSLATCESYHLGVKFELAGNPTSGTDWDAPPGTACTGSAADFDGADLIYDVKP